MTFKETAILTTEMAKSGTILENLNFDNKPIVDKHGCGGLGEKTSFILSPIFVEIGLINPMISGRGLGHTGGTVDKLESFKGFNSELDMEEMKKALK